MNVKLYYNEYCLGELQYENNLYLWSPNTQNIQGAIKKYPMGMEMFFLPIQTTTFKDTPHHYREFICQAERPDLAQKAGILNTDSNFEKLYKLSKLTYFTTEFVIKS